MGFEIGTITLGYRLLSLGMGLIPHIPDNAVSAYEERQPAKPKSVTVVEKSQEVGEMVDNIIQSIEAADKNTQVAVSEFLPAMEDMKTQTEREDSFRCSSAMQTEYRRKKTKKARRKDTAGPNTFSDVTKEMTDFFVTNMTCPPPLFYNSEAPEAPVLHQGLTFTEEGVLGVQTPQPNYAWGDEQTDITSSSDDTIRHEDRFSDSDVEEVIDFRSRKVIYKDSVKAVTRKTKVRSAGMTDKHLAQQTAQVVQSMNQQTNIKNLQQLPLLNALLKEIMALQGLAVPSATTTTTSTSRSTSAQSRHLPRDREEHLRKLATPRNTAHQTDASSVAKGHKVCTGGEQAVPKNKSWLRKDPEFAVAVPKTKLAYGMTNAQRLRLAKANPGLLKKLEKKDQERIEKSRERTRVKYLQYQKEAELGERLMQSARDLPSSRGQKGAMLGLSMESTGAHTLEDSKNLRRPIPTPRRSLSLKHEQMQEVLARMLETEPLSQGMEDKVVPDQAIAETRDNIYDKAMVKQRSVMKNNQNDSPRSQRSIDVYLPSASQPDMDQSDHEPVVEDSPPPQKDPVKAGRDTALGRTQTLYNPGFPTDLQSARDGQLSRPESRLTDYGQYSEDFENGHGHSAIGYSSGEEPSLRKIVDRYSDDSQSQHSQMSGEEPSLRRVVDKYSTDEEENSFRTAASDHSMESDHSRYRPSVRASASSGLTLNVASMPNPTTSIHSPVVAIRPQIPLTGEGLAASSTPTETEPMSQTAYIRQSQMPSLTETATSYDPGEDGRQSIDLPEDGRQSVDLRPRPSPRRTLDRMSSVHTESVSSYAPSDAPSDQDNAGPESGDYTESFDEESESDSGPAPAKQMSELHLAPAARMGYTWGHS